MAAPRHIAVIMDGNGRWALDRMLPREHGHIEGAKAVRRVVEHCCRLGVKHLTLFSFSTENWSREEGEVNALMLLFEEYLKKELPSLLENNIKLTPIGDLAKLPPQVLKALNAAVEATAKCTQMELCLAVSYGGREEILAAAQSLAKSVEKGEVSSSNITAELFRSRMWSGGLPDPELLIRTSGEQRISNFLLWQLAYSEIVVSPVLWPDFNEEELEKCITEFAGRERRFGLSAAPAPMSISSDYERVSN